MIDVGNRPRTSRTYDKGISGLHHRGSAFGIVGKFLHVYSFISVLQFFLMRNLALIKAIDIESIFPRSKTSFK